MDVRDGNRDKEERPDIPVDVNPSTTQLTLGSFSREADSSATILPLSVDTEALDISPVAALELLCTNIEQLGRATTEIPEELSTTAASVPAEQSHVASDPSRQEAKSPTATEFHCCRTTDHPAGREKRELLQQSVLARRFVSKREPPIPLREYLLRLHRYCPMSTAVYLAASVYITKMTAVEGVVEVAPRSVHRLVLAGLRVAMKALEDLSYPHPHFAKVGGVSERELSRLEVSFCFLVDFELRVDAQMLVTEARSIQSSAGSLDENMSC